MKFIGYCLPDISFQNEQFTEALYFNYATFYGVADFRKATFSNEAYFDGATFSDYVYFGATFSNEAYFDGATFSNKAYFSKATFSNKAYFDGATFYNADFTTAKFPLEVNFVRSKFLSEAYFSGEFNSPTFFNHAIFKEPSNVTFDINNMSNVSFSDSDITRIRFSDKVKWGGDDGFTVVEEEWLKDKSRPITLELVLSVYRNLRENYESRLRYGDAGNFFIKEMELKRKYREAASVSAVFKRKLIKLLKKIKLSTKIPKYR